MGSLQDQVESLLNVISYLLQKHDPSEIKFIDTKLFLNNFKKHIGIIEKCLGTDFGEMPTSNDDEESNSKEDTKEDVTPDTFAMKTEIEETTTQEEKDNHIKTNVKPKRKRGPASLKHKRIKDEGLFDCKNCGKSFSSKLRLQNHTRVHDDEKVLSEPIQCTLCSKKFETLKKMKRHKKDRHSSFMCTTCGDTFSGSSKLETHNYRVHEIGGNPCGFCKQICTSKTALRMHLLLYHDPNDSEETACTTCGKTFPSKRRAKQHEASFHALSFPCTKCPKTFSSRTMLEQHLKTHNAPTKCELCTDEFRADYAMKKHLYEAHDKTEFKPAFECDVCGSFFYRKTLLNAHKRVHEKDPKLVCNMCDKLFSSGSSLKIHIKNVHEKIKNNFCDQCDYKTGRSSKLKVHIKQVHENVTEACFMCQAEVKNLYLHVRHSHKDQPNAWKEYQHAKLVAERNMKIENKIQSEIDNIYNDDIEEKTDSIADA